MLCMVVHLVLLSAVNLSSVNILCKECSSLPELEAFSHYLEQKIYIKHNFLS